MKIWFKYLVGIVLGAAFSFFVPSELAASSSLPAFIADVCVAAGRYVLYPLVFFNFSVAVFEMRSDRQLFRVGCKVFICIIAATVLATFVGVVSVSAFSPTRIPMYAENSVSVLSKETLVTEIRQYVSSLLPSSMFSVAVDSLFILPLCIAATLLGGACAVDKLTSKPLMSLLDSCSRVFYTIASFFVEFLSICIIGITFYWMLCYREMMKTDMFRDLILVLLIDMIVLIGVIFPLILKVFYRKVNPYRVLYAAIAPVLAACFSGDADMVLPISIRHTRESLGVRRRLTSVALPLFSIFCRAGTALTVVTGFIIVLKSYSSLKITLDVILFVVASAGGLSFLLGRIPSGGVYITLALVCCLYGHSFEAGYLILKPAAFFMGSVAAIIDVCTAMFGTFLIAKSEGMLHDREYRFFI